MSIYTTAADINKLSDDLAAAKRELGQSSIESESARTLLLVERLVGIVESLDERSRESQHQLKRLQGDGK